LSITAACTGLLPGPVASGAVRFYEGLYVFGAVPDDLVIDRDGREDPG
jgi:hypothetical protein